MNERFNDRIENAIAHRCRFDFVAEIWTQIQSPISNPIENVGSEAILFPISIGDADDPFDPIATSFLTSSRSAPGASVEGSLYELGPKS